MIISIKFEHKDWEAGNFGFRTLHNENLCPIGYDLFVSRDILCQYLPEEIIDRLINKYNYNSHPCGPINDGVNRLKFKGDSEISSEHGIFIEYKNDYCHGCGFIPLGDDDMTDLENTSLNARASAKLEEEIQAELEKAKATEGGCCGGNCKNRPSAEELINPTPED